MTPRQVNGYELVERLDDGDGRAQVWEARHVDTGMRVAVKVIPACDEATFDSVMKEVRVLARLDHKNIVHLKTVFLAQDRLHIVMQYVQGSDLTRLLPRFSWANPDDIVALGMQVCQALAYLHDQNVCHCDVKPANILIADTFWENETDRNEAVKLTDLGIAEVIRARQAVTAYVHPRGLQAAARPAYAGGGGRWDSGEEQWSPIRGSPAYMSPERLRGKPATPQSDIWAVGVVFYELLTRRRPFDGEDFHAVKRSMARGFREPLPDRIPMPLRAIIERCLMHSPQDRFGSAGLLMSHLASINGDYIETARIPPSVEVDMVRWEAFEVTPEPAQEPDLELEPEPECKPEPEPEPEPAPDIPPPEQTSFACSGLATIKDAVARGNPHGLKSKMRLDTPAAPNTNTESVSDKRIAVYLGILLALLAMGSVYIWLADLVSLHTP